MYRLSPYTYLIEGLLGQGDYSPITISYVLMISPTALGHQTIRCSDVELVQLNPPSGLTCAQYLNPFISSAGGYLVNPNATTACSFCSMSTADQFLASGFNIFYDHAWRNFGLMFAYIVFNVSLSPFFDPLLKMHIDCSCVHCILYVPCPHWGFASYVW